MSVRQYRGWHFASQKNLTLYQLVQSVRHSIKCCNLDTSVFHSHCRKCNGARKFHVIYAWSALSCCRDTWCSLHTGSRHMFDTRDHFFSGETKRQKKWSSRDLHSDVHNLSLLESNLWWSRPKGWAVKRGGRDSHPVTATETGDKRPLIRPLGS